MFSPYLSYTKEEREVIRLKARTLATKELVDLKQQLAEMETNLPPRTSWVGKLWTNLFGRAAPTTTLDRNEPQPKEGLSTVDYSGEDIAASGGLFVSLNHRKRIVQLEATVAELKAALEKLEAGRC